MIVHFYNSADGTVFPELISVSQLQIRKAFPVIIVQRSKIQKLIFQEIVAAISDAAVAVIKQDIPGIGAKRQHQRL